MRKSTVDKLHESAFNSVNKLSVRLYLLTVMSVFAVCLSVFHVWPRPRISQMEGRELAVFPAFSVSRMLNGEYMRDISLWFCDTRPFRDNFIDVYSHIKSACQYRSTANDAVSIVSTSPAISACEPYVPMRKAQRGIVLVGVGGDLRALLTYAGEGGGDEYARTVNEYAARMPWLSVYSMIAPTATDFYMPLTALDATKPQMTTIANVHSKLADNVTDIGIYNLLKSHRKEDIYLRTDHHWSPLGAYYAAEAFAHRAEVPFRDLSGGWYSKHTIHGFVGSMHRYSGDDGVKSAPEDFIYHMPAKVEYSTSFIQYKVDRHEKITGQSSWFKSEFFKEFKDGSGGAYSTFMGSDRLLTVVRTSADSPRRLLIVKDSYGNAVPGYLFYSFNEIHIVDFRYFPENVVRYSVKNGITDLLFIFNVFNVYNPITAKKLNAMLM